MPRKRPTVADVRANKGKYQYTMLRVETWDELAAAEAAGIDMVSVPPELMLSPRFRDVGPSVFAVPGMNFFEGGSTDDFIRWSFALLKAGADAVYCSASLITVERLAKEAVPVIGHVGLIPSKATWTGGFKAVGKSADSAMKVFEAVKRYEEAGAFGAEIEVVPDEMATEIAKRSSLFLVSMGAGTGCDCQYLFSDDILGQNTGHIPRHAKIYRNFTAEYAKLQAERVAAMKEFHSDVQSGKYPEAKHIVKADPAEVAAFRKKLAAHKPS
jgi:3-methyl-2-oxobutanoate hydroxymethyltransferase